MRVGHTRTIRGAVGIAILCLVGTASVRGQLGSEQNPQLAREVFTNVPILGGVPVDEFLDTMGMFSNALNMNCTDCHTANSMDSWDHFAEDTPLKQAARRMVVMMATINRDNFGGARRVTCFTCHRGDQRPEAVAKLSVQYGVPAEDPDAFLVVPGFGTPSIDEVFRTYIQALGGAERVASLTGFVGRGTYSGYDTDFVEVPTEIFVQPPDHVATVIQGFYGDTVKTYDGREAWVAAGDKPVPLMRLTGGNLNGARVEALLAFPTRIQQAFSQWQVNVTAIDDQDVLVAQGANAGELPVNLYFDDAGLLVRSLRWTETVVGIVPTQVDYADYREVSGVQVPFRITATWTDGQSITQLSEVRPNVAIDAARFARPAPAAPR